MSLPFSAQVNATKATVGALPGTVTGWHIVNTTAAIAYVQVFNALAANVTVGTTTPDYVIPVPASGGAVDILLQGRMIGHSIGCVIACTTTRTGSTNAACDVLMWYENLYK